MTFTHLEPGSDEHGSFTHARALARAANSATHVALPEVRIWDNGRRIAIGEQRYQAADVAQWLRAILQLINSQPVFGPRPRHARAYTAQADQMRGLLCGLYTPRHRADSPETATFDAMHAAITNPERKLA